MARPLSRKSTLRTSKPFRSSRTLNRLSRLVRNDLTDGRQVASMWRNSPLSIEPLEERQLLTTTPVWVNDNWVVEVNNVGGPGVDVGDQVGDGAVTGKIFGTNAFDTIPSALAGVDNGGLINVLDGNYAGSLSITKNVTIAKAGAGTVTVTSGPFASAGVAIGSGYTVTIDGLTLAGALTGMSVSGSSVLLKNSIVQGASVFGVQVSGAGAHVEIDHSEIQGTPTTAAAVGISEGHVEVTHSILTAAQRGLLLSGSGTAAIHRSNLAGNVVKAVENAANPLTPTIIDASNNWWGSAVEASVEAQLGGDVDFTPYLTSGTDGDAGATGFVGDLSSLRATTHGKQTGSLGRLQEAVNLVMTGGTVTANDGLYTESNTTISQAMTLIGQSQSGVIIAPAAVDGHLDDSFAGPSLQQGLVVTANNVTISTLTIDGNGNVLLSGSNNFRSGIITPDDGVDTTDLTLTNLVVKNIYRRGIQISWSGTNNEVSNSTITQNSGALSSGGAAIGVFGGTTTAAIATRITGNNLTSTAATGIISNFGARLTVRGNQISNTPTGMNLAALDDTSIIGGPLPADANTIDLTGLASADIGVLVTFTGESPLTPGGVTVQGNQIIGSGQDAGIWAFRTGASPLLILDNTITATGSSSAAPGEGAGVFVTDDDELLGESASNNNANVELRGNTISGFYYGVHVRAVDDEGAAETLNVTVGGPTVADSNDISGTAASGSAGVYVEDNANPSIASVTVQNNAATISGFDTGIDVNGGSVTVTSNLLVDNNTGIRVRNAGSASISGNSIYDNLVGVHFESGGTGTLAGTAFDGGAADNVTDLALSLGAGLVTVGTGNAFAADTYFIDNQDTQNLSLVGNSTTFEGLSVANLADNFQIENQTHHRLDTDQPVGTGLVTWVAGTLYVTAAGSDHSIQRGVDSASSGNIIHVEAGSYQENVTVNKSLSLRGANYGVAGEDNGRTAESLVVTNGNQDRVFNVTANGITIDGFYIDGDDTSVLGVTLSNNSDANAAHAIRNTGTISGLTVAHNVIKHVGIGVRADGASLGNLITQNWFDGIGAYDYGYAVSLRNSFYADVTDNLMTEVHSGLHTNNFSGAIGPATWLFQGNEVHAYAAGVWHNLQYNNATNLTINNNDIHSLSAVNTVPGFANFDGNSIGILIVTQQDNVGVTITNNEIEGQGYGVVLYNTVSNNPVVLDDSNQIVNNGVGVYLTNIVGFNPVTSTVLGGAANNPNGVAKATLDGLSASNFSGNGIGVLVRGTNNLTPHGVQLTLQNGTSIAGGTTGLQLDGAAAILTGSTLSDSAFAGQSTAYVTLTNGAYVSGVIDGTSATFGGLTGAGATVSQNYAIEDKLTHAIDDPTVGFVRVHSGHVYVTPNSYVVGAADVQRAVAVAVNGDAVHVEDGSYTGNVSTAGKAVSVELGASPAQVTINGDVTLDGDDTLAMEVDGLTAGTEHDQLVVLGAVSLGGATLAVSGTISANPGESVKIIDNDAADPIGGVFAGLPANSTVTIAGQQFVIYYDGGDGNDVVLTRVPTAPPPSVVFVDDSWTGTFNGTDADGPLGGSFGNGAAFGYDQFDNLADAILAVAATGTVYVYNGTYFENVLVNKSLTLQGESSGPSGVVISVAAGAGLQIAADDVSVEALRIAGSGATTGILINGTVDNTDLSDVVSIGHDAAFSIGAAALVTDLTLDDVSLISSTTGLRVATTGQVDGLTVTASHFDSNDFGWEVNAAISSNAGAFTNVNVSANSTFDENEVKGIYVEKLDNAIFNGVQVYHSGFGGGSPAGIDFNLKYGTYSNITLQSVTVTNSGAGLTGSGITIKGRDDAPSYHVNPASVSGIFLTNVTIDGSPVDLTLGNNVTGVSFSNVDLLGTGLGLFNYSTVGALSLGDTEFAGTLAGYIINSSIYDVDATAGASFDGFATGTGNVPADLASYFDIADRIADAVDVAGLGLVRLKSGHVFVTPDSYVNLGTPPFTTTAPSLQRAVDAADAGDTVNIKAGTYSGSIAVSKDLNLIGPSSGTATIQPGAALGDLVLISGASFGDDQTVRLENLQFNGQSGLANYGVRVASTAVLDKLIVANGSFTGFNFDGIAVFGNTITGTSVSEVELTDLQFSNNGISGGGGMGDIIFDNYNADAQLSNLTLTGNRVGASGARLGIQFRGVASVQPMGNVDFDNVTVSGTYLTQFLGIQVYSQVPLLSFNDVQLGGGSSDITGTFGAALRFDKVGDLATKGLPGETTVDLGNTAFLGLTSYAGVNWDLEFAPDNTTAWLRADATATKWSLGGPAIDASLLTLSQAFDVEDRILHYVEPDHPSHLKPYKGFAELQDGKAFVTDTHGSQIGRAIEMVDGGGTVYIKPGTYAGNVDVNRAITLQTGHATTITGTLTVSDAGATIVPGFSPAILNTGSLSLNGTLNAELDGPNPGSGYDQLNVTGSVTIAPTTALSVTLNHAPSNGSTFVLINNDAADAVTGTFAGLPEGSIVTLDNVPFTISYTGGTGNDVTLTVVNPNTVWVNDTWVIVTNVNGPGLDYGDIVNSDGVNDDTVLTKVFGYDAFATIQDAINGVATSGTVYILAGEYHEDLSVNKTVSLLGQGISGSDLTTVSGVQNGGGATFQILASNVLVDGLYITRDWSVATWNSGLNLAGIAIQGLGITGTEIRNNKFEYNRTAIDLNNTTGHWIHNNVIDNNRTGLVLRNEVSNTTIEQNSIADNWTVGLVWLSGTPATAANTVITNNRFENNWFGQIVNRSTGAGEGIKDFSGNWLGTNAPVLSTANSSEPGYGIGGNGDIPTFIGGSLVQPAPASVATIYDPGGLGTLVDYTPWLESGVNTAGLGVVGFVGDFSHLHVSAASAQKGSTGRIQEGINRLVDGPILLGGARIVEVHAGSYTENVNVNKRLTLTGAGEGTNPATDTIMTSAAANTPVIDVTASGVSISDRVTVQKVRVTGASGASGDGIRVAAGSSTGFFTFDNVAAIGNGGNGIGFSQTGTVQDIVITDSNLSNNAGSGIRLPSSLSSVNGLLLSGSQINDNGLLGLSLNPSIAPGFSATNLTITTSSFSNNGDGVSTGLGDISLLGFNGTATISDVTITSDSHIGLQLRGANALAPSGSVTLTNVTIQGTPAVALPRIGTGIFIANYTDVSAIQFNNVDINITGTITGGLVVDTAGPATLDINDTSFGATTGAYIGVASVTPIDATGASFLGVPAVSSTTAQLYAVVDKIVDGVDIPGLGFVRLKAGQVYVTPNSYFSPATLTADIQRAIDVATSGDTVHVQSGSYTGSVDTSATSVTLSLGASAGQVTLIGDLVLDGDDTLEVEIYGAASPAQYDNFDVTGSVTLGGAILTLLPDVGYVPTDGDQIVLVNNDAADAVGGTFAGLPQSTVVVINGKSFRISYASADGLGNDVVLVANSSPVAVAGGPYTIAEGDSLALDGSGSFDPDLGDSIVSYEWDLDNDGFFDDATGISPSISWATLAALGVDDGLDNYSIGLRVTDQLGAQHSNYNLLTITNTAPTLTIGGASSVDEGALYTLNLSSSDPGNDTIVNWLINWGDGPAELVVGNPSTVTHVYADGLNNYVISATATDEDGTFVATPTIGVTVNNVAPTLTISGASSVAEGSVYTLFLNRTDPGADTIVQWTINWGDGPAQIVVGNPSSVTHTYADGPNGYVISATATDEDGTFVATPTIPVSVLNQSPTISLAGSDTSVNEGSAFSLILGAVTDPGTDSVVQYVVFWGDGSSNTYFTPGPKTHTYDDNALVTGPVTVTLVDEDGAHPLAGTWVRTVNNVAPTAIPLNGGPVNEGSNGLVLFVGQSDPSSNDTSAGFKYSYDFNNDLDFTDPGELFLSNLDSVAVPAQYLADDPSRTVRMRIHDKDGGFTEYFTTITVNNVAPVVNAGADATAFGGVAFSRTVNFTDPGSDSPWTVSVDWGFGFEPSFNAPTHTFNISHTYLPAQIGNTYTVQVKVDDNDGGVHIDTFDVLVVEDTFRVVDFQQNPSGFDVTFNRSPDLADLNLYDGLDVPVDLPDLTLVGSSVGNVRGSFVWNSATNTLTFVKTGGVLANDNYTVTLLSSAVAFNDDAGDSLLDGDSDYTPGGNYTHAFNVASSARTVSIRDFARGPGQDVDDNPATPDDLSVRIDNANGVTSVDFDVVFDPSLLTITSGSATLAPGLPVGWSITANLVSPGLLKVTTSGFTALSGLDKPIVRINTSVPASAPYGNSQAIRLVNVRVNEDAPGFASRGDLAIHKNAFLGDVDGDGSYLGFDSALISRVVVALDSGFDAHGWTDPRIVGDTTGDGTLSGQDASYVAQKLVALPRPEIPDITVFVLVPGTAGVDPELSIPLNIPGVQGSSVNVPVNINVLPAESVFSSTFDVTYETDTLSYVGATQGTFWSAGANWSFFANQISPGVVRVVLFNSTASAVGSGTIANLQFSVLGAAPLGSSPLGIAPVNPNEGGLTWTDVDGSVVITAPAVFGRHLFYNQSGTAAPLRYDGNNAAINANDDNAIATDKTAYLPGSGPATFANVSSYTKGINGIMIDISGTHAGITAADFIFRVGNNNTPSGWAAAPAPNSISVRAGAGVSGSDRVVITWANGAIAKQWLQVIVLANANTGLSQLPGYPAGQGDVFFFGNALADSGTGNSATQATVNTTDELAARNNPANLVSNIPITNLFDYNRDGQVNTTDSLASRNNPTNLGNVLRFINIAAPPAAPEATPAGAAFSENEADSSGEQAVASALSAVSVAPVAAPISTPAWVRDRLQTLGVRPQSPHHYFGHLGQPDTAERSNPWEEVADDLGEIGLDDELLESIVKHKRVIAELVR